MSSNAQTDEWDQVLDGSGRTAVKVVAEADTNDRRMMMRITSPSLLLQRRSRERLTD